MDSSRGGLSSVSTRGMSAAVAARIASLSPMSRTSARTLRCALQCRGASAMTSRHQRRAAPGSRSRCSVAAGSSNWEKVAAAGAARLTRGLACHVKKSHGQPLRPGIVIRVRGRRSAAAFWAHRVELRTGSASKAIEYLTLAAQEVDSFYGVVAREALGQKATLSFDLPPFDAEFMPWLAERPGGQRLFALLQIGKTHLAERELRYLWMEMPEKFHHSAMRLAAEQGMAGLSFRIAEIIRKETGTNWYGALYPLPLFKADFSIDEALVWAVSRQESGFNPRAKSRAKAAGLMQLMPATASFIAKDRGYRGRKRHQLFDPEVNLTLGQTYLHHLLDEPLIEKSLVRLLAAYNGGPGNLRKWLRNVNHQDDPFLLVESMPARETRYYVKNVISNLGIYRLRFNETAPALTSLAAGTGGIFVPGAATAIK